MAVVTASAFALCLFDSLEVAVYGKPLPIRFSRKEYLLLALLALKQTPHAEPQPVLRDSLLSDLYPKTEERDQAQQNLRKVLYALRQTLGDQVWRLPPPGARALSLDIRNAEIDLFAFDAAITQNDTESLCRALELYRGPLLPDCEARWVAQERERRRQRFHQAAQRLSMEALNRGDFGAALDFLHHARTVDWEWEPTLRTQMETMAAAGDREAALLGYRTYNRRLQDEQHRPPHPDTQALFRRLQDAPRQDRGIREEAVPYIVSPAVSQPRTNGLIGRDSEVMAIAAHVRTRSLVTLTGAGGVGKTRLGMQVVEDLAAEFADGTATVELALLPRRSNQTEVLRAVLQALGLREETSRTLLQTLVAYLQSRQILLLLDNCEHVVESCASLVQDLLARCPRLHILTTSQHPLRVNAEREWVLGPLATPHLEDLPLRDTEIPTYISRFPAVQLFVERAREVDRTFELTPENARSVARICAALDGIPLAILLAAVRVRGLAPEDIARRLHQRFLLLTQGERTALPRQQTLEATISWSYDLLPPRERALLCRLPVFRGGWTLEAAEGICAQADLPSDEIIIQLCSLVEKSLVQKENTPIGPRYRMLESIREYSYRHMCMLPDYEDLRRRHSEWYAGHAERSEPGLRGATQPLHLQIFDREQENLRAALDWCAEDAERNVTELRLIGALWLFWWIRGHFNEGYDRAIAAVRRTAAEDRLRARALLGAGIMCDYAHGLAEAVALLQEALTYANRLGDRWLVGFVLSQLGFAHRRDWRECSGYLNDALTIARQVGDRWLLAETLSTFGFVEFFFGNQERAHLLLQEGLPLSRALNDPWLLGEFYYHCGLVACEAGDYAAAWPMIEESLRLSEQLRDRHGVCVAHLCLGRLLFYAARYEEAIDRFTQSLRLSLELDYTRGIANALDGFARMAYQRGDWTHAAWLFGAAEARGAQGRALLLESWRREQHEIQQQLRLELGDENYARLHRQGQDMTQDEAITCALG